MSAAKVIINFCLLMLVALGAIFVYDGYLKDVNLAPRDMEQEHIITVMEEPFFDSYADGYLVRVRTEENKAETYQISSSYLKGEWNPEDRTGLLETNHTYQVHTWGTRNSVLRTYKNIIQISELTDQKKIERLARGAAAVDEKSRRDWENISTDNDTDNNKGGLY